ncbi:uncharacterized protein P174DRAFT_424805 [Aspergillus novofumigatus IBT 16806]|uniref:NADP-dependent oxidoreductase domain-containing protein n=1 Tax=Aspergillus novofumigatus (strain IBT 16806) TaxID=1392255 RepID=A0A2I1BW68_ASPN1|nr:uncharacterized protein P174DRAFT_424805 [Aspergillus novofumigatus IBT 16806]PKX89625.1 hypothetical protein P174DRAFT_424805 [Aspergillus novofumigatus IBT 16806]
MQKEEKTINWRERPRYGRTWAGDNRPGKEHMVKALKGIAKEVGAHSLGAVAIAYHLPQGSLTPRSQSLALSYWYLGITVSSPSSAAAKSSKHILSYVEAIDIPLTPEPIAQIEAVKAWRPGMPRPIIGDGIIDNVLGGY